MTTTCEPVETRAIRAVNPLVGVASQPGPEKQYHDEAFSCLLKNTNPERWSVFGEVPSPVGSIDILAIQADAEWKELAALIAPLARPDVDALSLLQRGRAYRASTMQTLGSIDDHSFAKLSRLGFLRPRDNLWVRSDLPSDLVHQVVAYEVKATGFPRGVVQAGRRSAVANETWLVIPTEATANALSERTWDLITRCGIGMRSADLDIVHPAARRPRPRATIINRVLRTIAKKANWG